MSRRFNALAAKQIPGGYVVKNAAGQALAYVYARETKADAATAKVLTWTSRRVSRRTSPSCRSYQARTIERMGKGRGLLQRVRRSLSLVFRRLTGTATPQLTQDQRDLIVGWADRVRQISQVRLFGSRALGSALPGSDIDLAVTIGHKPLKADTIRGIWFAVGKECDEELTALLGHKVHVSLYNDPDSDIVRTSCDEASVRLL